MFEIPRIHIGMYIRVLHEAFSRDRSIILRIESTPDFLGRNIIVMDIEKMEKKEKGRFTRFLEKANRVIRHPGAGHGLVRRTIGFASLFKGGKFLFTGIRLNTIDGIKSHIVALFESLI